jgi:hypothetical protein
VPFFIIMGEAEASGAHPAFEPGSLHSFVAVEDGNDSVLAQQAVTSQLLSTGFAQVTFAKLAVVPLWKRLFPTRQGRELRRLLRSGSNVMVFEDDNRKRNADA